MIEILFALCIESRNVEEGFFSIKIKKIDAIDHRGLYLVDDDGIPFVLAPDRKWFYPITRGQEYVCD